MLKNDHQKDRLLDKQISERSFLVNQVQSDFDELRMRIQEKQTRMPMITHAEIMSFVNCNADSKLSSKSLKELRSIEAKMIQWKDYLQRL